MKNMGIKHLSQHEEMPVCCGREVTIRWEETGLYQFKCIFCLRYGEIQEKTVYIVHLSDESLEQFENDGIIE